MARHHDCKYCIIAREVGEQGTAHLHIYIEFDHPVKWTTMKNSFPRADIEKRKGTAKQAVAYCKKDGDYEERGTVSNQGYRSDLAVACARVVAARDARGSSARGLSVEFPETFVRYHRGLERLAESLQKDRDRTNPPVVVWLWGKAGVGKSRMPHDIHGDDEVFIKDGTNWWNGYAHQEAIVVDDFDGKWPFRNFLRFIDRYAFSGETKGGYVKINSPYIYITCEHPPEHFWMGNELEQIKRRITHIHELH